MKMLEGHIKFIHLDGKEYHFATKRNELNNAQMYTWDNWKGCFASDLRYVKSIIRDIIKKAEVLENTITV